jgi:hypothetical protein
VAVLQSAQEEVAAGVGFGKPGYRTDGRRGDTLMTKFVISLL